MNIILAKNQWIYVLGSLTLFFQSSFFQDIFLESCNPHFKAHGKGRRDDSSLMASFILLATLF